MGWDRGIGGGGRVERQVNEGGGKEGGLAAASVSAEAAAVAIFFS